MTLILGIESSCDDTAIAVVNTDRTILSNRVFSQSDLHADFGGIVPEIAARAHAERLDIVAEAALTEAGVALGDIDLVAVTSGPGLIGGVLSGVMFAKGMAAGADIPLIGVNHLAGHALTPRLTDGLEFPYLMLLVSGGHCQFLAVTGPDEFTRMGGTIDDAPGEAFDKTARLLGLSQPGGPLVQAEAESGDPKRFAFPRPLMDRPGFDMSFSGLKTALRRARDKIVEEKGGITRQDRADLCASFQQAVADVLRKKTARALTAFAAEHGATTIAVAGGVAANTAVRAGLQQAARDAGFTFTAPPLKLCTDNGAMIAWAGWERYRLGQSDDMTLAARPRWPLDKTAAPMLGSGKRGAKA
ncbi:N6-L-threonylcarbamoyladenine synthase [Monaibacterium marinum]|uniref:tRNA N6-adenosine threonylcarbamoyltransferase n=1 Tax=Pontivivens marinum TaxID=1690039 RepID=A0A2C9CNJ4_9RHOB|nr:tRNA (adenosine(37)-N6)-threonylcarbamoyltransferase complex transferase subunit TsaD [Monaibacterium marinum]SOH93101.1 N6-L-threonylcarbamoyladenine synthase [Monaibacterium marinum]